ncbi:unnamed protein product [Lactuca virosa]|uniref:BHLH domain-containing protein n=1 Tax=Lactuca virosa TaxID=75947 RepID=A0AAU9P0K6_9ASTR|nr:unnamed protein product [Lactuca virosa]
MEISHFRNLSELTGMEDASFNFQCPVNSFDNQQQDSIQWRSGTFGDNMDRIHGQVGVFDYYKPVMEPSSRPSKQLKTSSWNSSIATDHSHSLMNLNLSQQATVVKPKEEMTVSSKSIHGFIRDTHLHFSNQESSGFNKSHHGGFDVAKNSSKHTPAQDHILAERKMREKLSRRFIALSALVPGLKKVVFLFFSSSSKVITESLFAPII